MYSRVNPIALILYTYINIIASNNNNTICFYLIIINFFFQFENVIYNGPSAGAWRDRQAANALDLQQ